MSFSFQANGTPGDAIRTVGQQVAAQQAPQPFGDAINNVLSQLPKEAKVTLNAYGHTGWGEAQTRGSLNLHVDIDVVAQAPKAADQPDTPAD